MAVYSIANINNNINKTDNASHNTMKKSMDGNSFCITPVECKLIINTERINIIYIKIGIFMVYIISHFYLQDVP